MQRRKNIFFNIILCLNCLLLLFVLAGDKLKVPAWLQVAGRMHPLLLHFPIVLLLLYIFRDFFLLARPAIQETGKEDEAGKWLLLTTAFTAALTALMGFFLSKEEGYNQQALWWHKWGGVSVSLFTFFWYSYRNNIHSRRYLPQTAAVISFVLILFTGHQGSNITHGENYLLAPVMHEKTKPVVPIDQALVFADMVKPVLEAKCISCHNAKKAKGELVMETEALLLKGGKHGLLFTAGQPEISLLLERIHMPPSEKKHMPPAGKPQLDETEISILYQWIKEGAGFKQKVTDLPATDSLRILANTLFEGAKEETFEFAAAKEETVEKLNNTNRLVHPIALGSPALAVNFYNRQNYTTAALKDLLEVKPQIVSLNMAYMPVTDADIAVIAQFINLRKLNLNFTTVSGKSLATLGKLHYLNHLSLSGTEVNKNDIVSLTSFPALRFVYLWNAPVSTADMAAIRKKTAGIYFETGFMNDTLVLKLNPPVLETEERIVNGTPLSILLKHYIKGAVIRYTTDGSSPDSLHSEVYKDEIILNKAAVLKARAFKPGWLGSDSIMTTFYKNTYRADSIRSITALDSVFKGKTGAKTLINGEKGDFNFRNGKWLGFRRNAMEMVLRYNEPVAVSSVTLSSVVDIGGYIMPPASIEVWGGASENKLSRLVHLSPHQPDSMHAAYMQAYDCNFAPVRISVLKIIAVPVGKLPGWHPAKGQKGWFFTDELFVN